MSCTTLDSGGRTLRVARSSPTAASAQLGDVFASGGEMLATGSAAGFAAELHAATKITRRRTTAG
jgi:hypothetical protein